MLLVQLACLYACVTASLLGGQPACLLVCWPDFLRACFIAFPLGAPNRRLLFLSAASCCLRLLALAFFCCRLQLTGAGCCLLRLSAAASFCLVLGVAARLLLHNADWCW